MKSELANANIVVVANQFNVSIFNLLWFIKNEIVREEDVIAAESIFIPVAVQIGTANSHLLIVPERLQMTLKRPEQDQAPVEAVSKMIQKLPETPYIGLGMNVIWHLSFDDGNELGEFTRRNFTIPGQRLFSHFSDANARFGAYLSKNFDAFRLNLDVKPVIVDRGASKAEKLQLNFNFNLDIADCQDKAAFMRENLSKWSEIFSESKDIVHLFDEQ